jgi:acyl-CoA thioester hydrolase
MNRIKVEIAGTLPFATRIPVRITDLNYGNHVGNDVFLSLLHEARVQFLASLGFTELDFGGLGLIMADVAMEYKNEIKYGDTIAASVGVGAIGRNGFDLLYVLTIERDHQTLLAARAKTGMLYFDYDRRKTVTLPPEIAAILTAMQPSA